MFSSCLLGGKIKKTSQKKSAVILEKMTSEAAFGQTKPKNSIHNKKTTRETTKMKKKVDFVVFLTFREESSSKSKILLC